MPRSIDEMAYRSRSASPGEDSADEAARSRSRSSSHQRRNGGSPDGMKCSPRRSSSPAQPVAGNSKRKSPIRYDRSPPPKSSPTSSQRNRTKPSVDGPQNNTSPIPPRVALEIERANKIKAYDYNTKLSYLFRDARFFMLKSANQENINISKRDGVWSTMPMNVARLNQAFKECRNVILIFSAIESRRFAGIARLGSASDHDRDPVPWVLPPNMNARLLDGVFEVDWVSKHELPFERTLELCNPWNNNRPVKIGRDGQEIEPLVAEELCRMFPEDHSVELTPILYRSKRAAKNLKGSAPGGPTIPRRHTSPLGGIHSLDFPNPPSGRGRGIGRGTRRGGAGYGFSHAFTDRSPPAGSSVGFRSRSGNRREDEYCLRRASPDYYDSRDPSFGLGTSSLYAPVSYGYYGYALPAAPTSLLYGTTPLLYDTSGYAESTNMRTDSALERDRPSRVRSRRSRSRSTRRSRSRSPRKWEKKSRSSSGSKRKVSYYRR